MILDAMPQRLNICFSTSAGADLDFCSRPPLYCRGRGVRGVRQRATQPGTLFTPIADIHVADRTRISGFRYGSVKP